MIFSVFSLSKVLKNNFTPEYGLPFHKVDSLDTKLTYNSSGRQTHYGMSVFRSLNKLLPGVWVYTQNTADLDNTNKNKSHVAWYLDGSKSFTEKHNLPEVSKYAIGEYTDGEHLLIQKPSHAYIGSGKFITIGRDIESLVKERQKEYKLGKDVYPIDHWVVQPLIQPALWSGGRKFDCRFFGVIFNIGDRIYATSLNYGVARIAVNVYNPDKDPLSAITNISVQERIKGYDIKSNLLAVNDDLKVVENILSDLVKNTKFTITDTYHILILGFDIMFTPYGKPVLIEVNHEPHIEIYAQNAESYCSIHFVNRLFGEIIPGLIQDLDIPDNELWSPIIVQ